MEVFWIKKQKNHAYPAFHVSKKKLIYIMKVDLFIIQNHDKNPNGFLKLNFNEIPLPSDFLNLHQMMVCIPPQKFGGNHKHPRREIFVCLNDDVELHWIDKDGIKHKNKMKDGNQLYLFDVHPFVPHAIINLSKHSSAVLLELADNIQYGVEPFQVL